MIAGIFGLLGVIVGGVMSIVREVWIENANRKRSGRYSAARIIAVLEDYANKCVDVAADDGTVEGRPGGRTEQGEEFYEAQVTCPDPPRFADDIDWKSIDPSLMYRALMLKNAAIHADRYIAASAEYSVPPRHEVLFEARQCGYAKLGLEALAIIRELQGEYCLPPTYEVVSETWWNPYEIFNNKLAEREQIRLRRDSSPSMVDGGGAEQPGARNE